MKIQKKALSGKLISWQKRQKMQSLSKKKKKKKKKNMGGGGGGGGGGGCASKWQLYYDMYFNSTTRERENPLASISYGSKS